MITERDFTAIYKEHTAKVYRLCLGYASGDKDLAQEWHQQAFIKAWNHRKSFKGKAAIGSWIYRIAVNVCLADLRKPKTRTALREELINQQTEDQQQGDNLADVMKLYHCIDKLTGQNKILIMMEMEDIPQAAIADTLGLKHGAVRTRLSRIRASLLKCITNEK